MRAGLEKFLLVVALAFLAGFMAAAIVIGARYSQVWVGVLVTQLVTMCVMLMLVVLDCLLIRLFISESEEAGSPEGRQQTLFPLMGDNLRSNSRSAPLFAVLYMLLFSLIFMLIILTFSTSSTPTPKLSFVSRPAPFTIGTILDPVTVSVTLAGEPVEDEEISIAIYPVDPISLRPAINNQPAEGRTLNCLRQIAELAGLHSSDDEYFCGPWVYQQKTNAEGMAAFYSMVVPSGAPVSYAFVAYSEQRPTESVTEIVAASFAASKVSLSTATPMGDQDLELNQKHSFDVFALVRSLKPPALLVATVMPLFVNRQGSSQTWMFFGATDSFGDVGAVITNSRALSASIVQVSSSDQDGYATYNVSFAFRDVQVAAVSSVSVVFAVAIGSVVVPFSSFDFSIFGSSSPEELVLPFFSYPQRAADAPTVQSIGWQNGQIQEAETLQFSVRIGAATAEDRYGFLMVAPAAGNGSTVASIDEHPSTRPKELSWQVFRIPAGETVISCNSIFSVSGAVGDYLLSFIVNSVHATWPGGSANDPLRVTVTSSVATVTVAYRLALQTEVVGKPWEVMPVVTMFQSNGLPVIGKTPLLVTTDASGNDVGVTFESQPSTSSGDAIFTSIRVGFARNIAAGQTQELSFKVIVDGVVRTTLARNLRQPVQLASECSFVRFKPIARTLRGVSSFTIETLNTRGSPVASAVVQIAATDAAEASLELSETADSFDVPVTSTVTTGGTGLATLYIATSAPGVSGVRVAAACDGGASQYDSVATLVFASAAVFALVDDSTDGTITVTSVIADWSDVSATAPIVLSAQVVFAPGYIDQYLGADQVPHFPTVSIAAESDLPATLTFDRPAVLPSGFYMLVILADGVRVGSGTLDIVKTNPVVTLKKSAFGTAPFVFNAVNADQPEVEVTINGAAAAGLHVYAQLTYVIPGTASGAAQDILSAPSSILYGFVRTDGTATSVVAITDANGIATFSDLVISNVPNNVRVSLRYCIASGLASGYSICADDTGSALHSGADVKLNASSSSLVGAAGAVVDNIITLQGLIDGAPASAMRCTALAVFTGTDTVIDNFLVFYEPIEAEDDSVAHRVFATTNAELGLKIGVGPTAINGLYTVRVVCAGGSLDLPIVLTSAPFSIRFTDEPSSAAIVGNVEMLSLEVRSPGGQLPNAIVGLRLRMPCGDHACYDSSIPCGEIGGRIVGKTDKDGRVTLSYFVASTPSARFKLDAFVLRNTDPEFRSHSLSSGAAGIESLTGVDLATLSGLFAFTPTQLVILRASQTAAWSRTKPEKVVCNGESDSEEDSSSGEALKEFFAYAGQPAVQEISTTLMDVDVSNPVATITVLSTVALTMKLPQQISGFRAKPATLDVSLAAAPRLLLTDTNGNPVVNASVQVTWLSPSAANATVRYPLNLKSDASGRCTVHPLFLRAETGGDYSLIFSSRGAGAVAVIVQVQRPRVISQADAMKLAAYVLFGLCSPLFLLLVPHSRMLSFAITVVLTAGAAVVIYLFGGIKEVLTSIGEMQMNSYVLGYFYLVIALLATVLAGFVLLLVLKLVSQVECKKKYALADDEISGDRRFKYVQWLVNVRLPAAEDPSASASTSKGGQPADIEERKAYKVPDTSDQAKHQPPTAAPATDKPKAPPVIVKRELKYDPALDPTEVPVSVWAALGVGALFIGCSILFLLYIRDTAVERLKDVQEFFPSTDAFNNQQPVNLTVADVMVGPIGPLLNALPSGERAAVLSTIDGGLNSVEQRINRQLLQSRPEAFKSINTVVSAVLLQMTGFLSKKFPQVTTLAPLIANLQDVDLLDLLGRVHSLLRSVVATFKMAFIVAMVVSLCAVAVMGITAILRVRQIAADIRRGLHKFDKPPTALIISPYVPLHAFHFLIMHQFLFWVLFLVVFVLAWEKVRELIFTIFIQVVLPAVVSGALMKMLQNLILKTFFLASDQMTVVRPELFSFWVLFSVASSSIAAVGLTIARFAMYIVTGAICFARLDFPIYPRPLAQLDGPHNMFIAVVAMEVRASNPIVMFFSAVLLCGLRARDRMQQAREASDPAPVPLRELLLGLKSCGCRATLSGGVTNMAAAYGRMMSTQQGDDDAGAWDTTKVYGAARWAARNRIANRFWLAVLLCHNPSLRHLRKPRVELSCAAWE